MISPEDYNIANLQREFEDREIRDIELKMDRGLPEAVSQGLPHCFVIVEDYSIGTRRRLWTLVDQYRAAGWHAEYYNGGHFMIYLEPPIILQFPRHSKAPKNVFYPVQENNTSHFLEGDKSAPRTKFSEFLKWIFG